jgi:nucleoid DNA-binding protein
MKNLPLTYHAAFGPLFALFVIATKNIYQPLRRRIMTRAQLVSKLSSRMDVTKKEADLYLTAFLDSIMETLHKDGRVVVQGFGSFKVNEYKARVAKKPLTGELIQLPVRRKPSFHAGKELREKVNKEMVLAREAEGLLSRISVPENVFSISAG